MDLFRSLLTASDDQFIAVNFSALARRPLSPASIRGCIAGRALDAAGRCGAATLRVGSTQWHHGLAAWHRVCEEDAPYAWTRTLQLTYTRRASRQADTLVLTTQQVALLVD